MTKFENSWSIIRKKVWLENSLSQLEGGWRVKPTILKFSHYTPNCLGRWNRQCVQKRRHIKFRRRGITQKKTHNMKYKVKVWNQENKSNFRPMHVVKSLCFLAPGTMEHYAFPEKLIIVSTFLFHVRAKGLICIVSEGWVSPDYSWYSALSTLEGHASAMLLFTILGSYNINPYMPEDEIFEFLHYIHIC
jgi:hypothetical protein